MVLIGPLDVFVSLRPEATPTIYIDDFGIQLHERVSQIVSRAIDVCQDLVTAVGQANLSFSKGKWCVVASKFRIASAVVDRA